MKKILILFLCLLCLTGCSSTSSNIDIQTLDSELSQKIIFEDELTLYEGNVQDLYGIEEPKSSIVYVGSGATAEELAFFEFEYATTANEAYEQLEYGIQKEIDTWPQEKKELLFQTENIADFIHENQPFYINQKNQIVVVFEKYEIGVGTLGQVEFIIEE